MVNKLIKIHIIGLETQSMKILEFFFHSVCLNRFEISTKNNADVFMVNMDGIKANKSLDDLEKIQPLKPIILMAIDKSTISNSQHYSISRPVVTKELLDVLQVIEKNLSTDSALITNRSKIGFLAQADKVKAIIEKNNKKKSVEENVTQVKNKQANIALNEKKKTKEISPGKVVETVTKQEKEMFPDTDIEMEVNTAVLSQTEKYQYQLIDNSSEKTIEVNNNITSELFTFVPQEEINQKKTVNIPAPKKKNMRRSSDTRKIIHKTALSQTDEMHHFLNNNHRPDIDLLNESQLHRIYFDPKYYFVGYIQEAIKIAKERSCSILLKGLWDDLMVSPNLNLVSINLSDSKLRSYCVAKLGSKDTSGMTGKVSYINISDKEVEDNYKHNALFPQHLDTFLWKMLLWTSRGRLPAGTDIIKPLNIKSWPNFSNFISIPFAAEIVEYSQKNKDCSISDIARNTGVKQCYIFSLYSTVLLIGSTESYSPVGNNKIKPKGLFSKAVSSLKVGKWRS